MSNKKLEAALKYKKAGFSVIPLHTKLNKDGATCSCGKKDCDAPGKHPRIIWKDYISEQASEGTITEWWEKWPDANIGIVCGEISGRLAVLDIDSPEIAKRLLAIKITDSTLVVQTPRGGLHVYLREERVPNGNGVLLAGVADFRGQGGYVVAPPSDNYRWLNKGKILKVPDGKAWAVEKLKTVGVSISESSKPELKNLETGPIPKGARDNTLTSLAGTLWHKGLPVNVVSSALEAVNQEHTEEPLPLSQIKKIVDSVSRYPRNSTTPQPTNGCGAVEGGDVYLELVSLGDVPKPKDRKFVVEGLIPEGWATILYGDGGSGKSLLAMAMGMRIATGDTFLGIPTVQRKVLYLDWELDLEEQARRAYQIAHGFGLSKPPKGLLYFQPEWSLTKPLRSLQKSVEKEQIGLVIIDSVGLACGGDSESASFIIPFIRSLRSLKTTLLMVDHQSKIQHGHRYEAKTPFGSVYKINLSRSVIQVQATPDSETSSIISLEKKKANFGPLNQRIGLHLSFSEEKILFEKVDPAAHPAFIRTGADKIVAALKRLGTATKKQLVEETGMNAGTVENCLAKLKKQRQIHVVGHDHGAPVYGLVKA